MSGRITLFDIVQHKKEDVAELKSRFPMSKVMKALERSDFATLRRNFKKAISYSHHINIIGEIKKASPSEGIIRDDFNPLKIAEAYEYTNIKALSVLTEQHFFKGRTSYLKTVRQVTRKPLLRKDFIIDQYQIYETALYDADAVLLIASILTLEELKFFIAELKRFYIDALVEVHNDEDLDKALVSGAEIIGINNRDLSTFTVDLAVTERLIRKIPRDKIIISESGIVSSKDIHTLKSLGVHAFLVGTSFMRAPDIVRKIQELLA